MVSPRIYLVEDDHEVRGATRLLLQAHGYAVRDFEDSETLLESADWFTGGTTALTRSLSVAASVAPPLPSLPSITTAIQ